MNKQLLIVLALVLTITLTFPLPAIGTVNGNGVLYVYNEDGSSRQPNPQGQIDVIPGETITFQIKGITEYSSSEITVWIQWDILGNSYKRTFENVDLISRGGGKYDTENITWLVGEFDTATVYIPYCTTGVVWYGISMGDKWRSSNQMGTGSGGHLHAIPEVPLGTVATLAAGFCAMVLLKRKRL